MGNVKTRRNASDPQNRTDTNDGNDDNQWSGKEDIGYQGQAAQ